MANWLPSQISPDANYLTLLDTLGLRDEDAAKMAEFPTNPPVGFMRFNRSGPYFQEWIGAVWETKVLAVAGGGTGATTPAGAVAALGLGTMSTQNNNAVNITGGTITGLTNLTTNAATINGAITVTNFVQITGANPQIICTETDAPANQKTWSFSVDATSYKILALNDAFSVLTTPMIITRAGHVTFAGNITTLTGGFLTPDSSKFAIAIGNNSITFGVDEYHFKDSSGVTPLIDIYKTTVAPASHPGGRFWFNGGYAPPVAGKIIIGDGSGWVMHVSKKSGGTITDLFEFNDSGQHRTDWLKSLNASILTLEAFTAGGFHFRFFDSANPIHAALISPSTFRVNRIQAWDSFTLTLEAFVEGVINFSLTGAVHAQLQNSSTFLVNTIKNLNGTTLALDSTNLISMRIAGAPFLSISNIGVTTQKAIGFGGLVAYNLGNAGDVNNNLAIGDESMISVAMGGTVELTGIAGGFTGRMLFVYCNGNSLVLKHQDARSLGNNQISTRLFSDMTFNFTDCFILIWKSDIAKWIVFATNW